MAFGQAERCTGLFQGRCLAMLCMAFGQDFASNANKATMTRGIGEP